MSEPAPTLEYATRQPPLWRRHRRLLIVLTTFLLIAGVGFFFRAPISRRAEEIYWSRRCLAFSAPKDTPLELPMFRDGSIKDPDYALPQSIPPRMVTYSPRCWREMERLCRLGGDTNHGTLFLGELRTPAGNRRIVHVVSLDYNLRAPLDYMRATVIEPAAVFSPPRVIYRPRGGYLGSGQFIAARFMFGQPDSQDRSHFTIEAHVANHFTKQPDDSAPKVIIDGYLGDDERVMFRLRDPATTHGL